MNRKRLSLQWKGTFIELCMGRLPRVKKGEIDARCTDVDSPIQSSWYDNAELLKTLFGADNWWSVDDLDHAMGLVFAERSALDTRLAKMTVEIDGTPVTVDPEAFQLSFYAPEAIDPLEDGEMIVCHGAQREATLHLQADFEAPFDPSLITLSFLHYRDYGYILIDLDYDGHDDVQFDLGDTTYLQPRCFGKDYFNDTSR
ncbi:hypothetical protein [uncultured Desulfosarcina sp.]|uniref:hypothetical protein n=1 Tax=uncultured Desulfosarcina sp. TaxID=218289 RepID=UPI0029C8D58F|nr:hypothetical protein [uncultured Desulfosarcina sp.]